MENPITLASFHSRSLRNKLVVRSLLTQVNTGTEALLLGRSCTSGLPSDNHQSAAPSRRLLPPGPSHLGQPTINALFHIQCLIPTLLRSPPSGSRYGRQDAMAPAKSPKQISLSLSLFHPHIYSAERGSRPQKEAEMWDVILTSANLR